MSFQHGRAEARNEWKERVKTASSIVLPEKHQVSQARFSATLFYFPDAPMQGDIDNIIKLVLDALCKHIFVDDSQIDRVVAQRFAPGNVSAFGSPSATLEEALKYPKSVLYVRLSDDPFEDLI